MAEGGAEMTGEMRCYLGGMSRLRPGIEESLGLGGIPPLFSTQQRMLEEGHCTSSSTESHMRLARAWIHLPGQASTWAVLVTDPSRPATR